MDNYYDTYLKVIELNHELLERKEALDEPFWDELFETLMDVINLKIDDLINPILKTIFLGGSNFHSHNLYKRENVYKLLMEISLKDITREQNIFALEIILKIILENIEQNKTPLPPLEWGKIKLLPHIVAYSNSITLVKSYLKFSLYYSKHKHIRTLIHELSMNKQFPFKDLSDEDLIYICSYVKYTERKLPYQFHKELDARDFYNNEIALPIIVEIEFYEEERNKAIALNHLQGKVKERYKKKCESNIQEIPIVKMNLNKESVLHQKGYQITSKTRSQRWKVLQECVKEFGLYRTVYVIDKNKQLRLKQKNGVQKFKYAINEWNYDLEKLKIAYYQGDFKWPL